MKWFKYFILLAALYFLSACLGYRAVEWRIHFNDNFTGGTVTVTFEDLTSDELNLFSTPKEREPEKRKQRIRAQKEQDFKQLLDSYRNDSFLLDGVEMGVYIKERRLFEKDGKLYGSFSGVFRKLTPESDLKLELTKDEIVVTLQNDAGVERIETDGRMVTGEETTTITWPKTTHLIYWKTVMKKENPGQSHSLVGEFRRWQKGEKFE